MGGPGSAKVRQGSIFDEKTLLILRFWFFALNDVWKAPRGSQERGAEQQEFQRGGQGGAPSSLWGPKGWRGGPSGRTGGPSGRTGGDRPPESREIPDIVDFDDVGNGWIPETITPMQPERARRNAGTPGETDKEGFYLMTPVPGGYGGFNRSAHSAGPVHFCGLFVFVIRGRVVDEWWPIQLVQSSHISGMVEHAGQSSRLL